MSTAQQRRHARAAAAARARAAQLADSWDHAAPRRPMHGHGPDCPNREQGWMRRCPHCLADADVRRIELERQQRAAASAVPEPRQAEERSCPRCYAPTTDPERHCT